MRVLSLPFFLFFSQSRVTLPLAHFHPSSYLPLFSSLVILSPSSSSSLPLALGPSVPDIGPRLVLTRLIQMNRGLSDVSREANWILKIKRKRPHRNPRTYEWTRIKDLSCRFLLLFFSFLARLLRSIHIRASSSLYHWLVSFLLLAEYKCHVEKYVWKLQECSSLKR